MIEGGSSKAFANTKRLLFNDPDALHLLLDKLAQSVIAYLNQQILSGADSVMIFDTWGGVLSKQNYLDFSLNYMAKIVKSHAINQNFHILRIDIRGNAVTEVKNMTCIAFELR
jgi:uroporphyrinogen decarboxylase